MQSLDPSHHWIRQHNLLTNNIRHKPQQNANHTKHSPQNRHRMHSRHKHHTLTLRNTNTPTQNTPNPTCQPTKNKSNTTTTPTTYTTKPTSPSTKTKRITLSKFHLQQIHTNWTKSHKRNNNRYNQSYPHTNSKRTH